ncbi:MAG: hypothetical protein HKN82_17545, partial [Akkermansiaceae bacterium]|nr:hypothetical protein [Akkermansiaceae bacterium]
TIDLATADRRLRATGSITEPGGKILDLQAALPLRFKEALEDPELLKSLPLSAEAAITNFGVPRLQILVPQLAEADGVVDGKFTVAGPLGSPELGGGISVKITRYPLPGTPYREITDTTLILNLDGDRIIVPPSPLTIAGGKLVFSGTVSPFGAERAIDLQLNADHALLWRDKNMSIRADADLALRGPLQTARLTGTIDLVESLYYKDIEIIPFGLPAATVPEPELPTVTPRRGGNVLDLPDPFGAWALDVRVRTADPFLIRGNLATGSATGDAVIRGTLNNPRPEGRVTIDQASVDLPFSKLEVKRGAITLRPNAPLDPAFEIRGTSSVQSHLITLFIFGTLSDPDYSLVSSPPLPESEILTLLATGTTIGDLDDPELAKMRAFQLLLADLRLRSSNPEANPALRALSPVLGLTKDLDLRIGDNDRFSGRQFNSASIELTDRWFLTFQIDAEGHSRGLIRYSLRGRK